MLVFLSLPVAAAAFVATRLARSSKASWRIAAWVPVLPVALVCANILFGVVRDPTAHNLWPFEVAFSSLLSLLLFGVYVLLRRLFRR
jgi:hypothetical protein